jgi:hypothetical protein
MKLDLSGRFLNIIPDLFLTIRSFAGLRRVKESDTLKTMFDLAEI